METKKLYEIIGDKDGRFYSDEYGYINGDCGISIKAVISRKVKTTNYSARIATNEEKRTTTLSISSIYRKKDDKYVQIDIRDFLDLKIKHFYASVWDGYSGRARIDTQNPFEIEFINFSFSQCDFGGLDGFRQALEKKVYVLPKDYKEEPLYNYEIKKGDYIVSTSQKRRCKQMFLVKEVYHQPNENNLLCKLYSEYDGYEFDASCAWGIWQLPYKKYPERANELAQFNDEIRERELNPLWEIGSYTMTSGGDYNSHTSSHAMSSGNLYWQKMEEAASYTVSLYKYYPNKDVEKKLYLLEEFEVDRNKHWLTINNLFGNNYIIRIKAEDRSGGILAVSRGIKIKWTNVANEQKPEFWK